MTRVKTVNYKQKDFVPQFPLLSGQIHMYKTHRAAAENSHPHGKVPSQQYIMYQILSPLAEASQFPFSPRTFTGKLAGAGPRRLIAGQGAYTEVKGCSTHQFGMAAMVCVLGGEENKVGLSVGQ